MDRWVGWIGGWGVERGVEARWMWSRVGSRVVEMSKVDNVEVR